MIEEEIVIEEEKAKVVRELPQDNLEDNNTKIYLDDTIELDDVVREVKNNE